MSAFTGTRRLAENPVPQSVAWASKATSSLGRMYLNDQLGDCCVAMTAHQIGVYTANEGPAEIQFSDPEIQAIYQSVCGPGDNGCNPTDVFDAWAKDGLTASGAAHTIAGYAAMDWTIPGLAEAVLADFGPFACDLNLPSDWTSTNTVWGPTTSEVVGGHCVPAIQFNKDAITFSSWEGLSPSRGPSFGIPASPIGLTHTSWCPTTGPPPGECRHRASTWPV